MPQQLPYDESKNGRNVDLDLILYIVMEHILKNINKYHPRTHFIVIYGSSSVFTL